MHIPQRMCASCRRKGDKKDFLRICKKADVACMDLNKKNHSRGMYVCKSADCIEKLKKNKAIQRVLKVEADESFYEELKSILTDK